MKRRAFLKAATAAATSAMAAPYVHAQSKKFAGITLRINGWGGAWDGALKKSVAAPLEEKYGLKVQFDAGTAGASDLVKLIANKDNPPYDIFQADNSRMVELLKAGILEQIKPSDVPNVKRVLPEFREYGDYGAAFSISAVIPVYNSKHIKQPLTSYSDIGRPDLKDRVVIPAPGSIGLSLGLLAMAEENGGSVSNMEPAFKVLAAAKPNIVAFAQTNVAQVQMFQNEEAYAGIFWDGRAHEVRTKGVPLVTVVPAKGIYSVIDYITVVKGMKYPDAAHAFIDQLLSDQGMLGIPQALRYSVTTDIKLPEDLRKELLFNSPERNALNKKVDWAALAANQGAWFERVNKIVKS